MCQSHRIAERVDLPLALAQLRANRGLVVLAPRAGLRAEVEGVCIRVNEDTARLAVNDPGDHIFELPVSTRERQVGCNLRGRVAQPHRVYVSGDHVRIQSAFVRGESDGRIERVREAVLKQPGKFRIANGILYFDDLRFDSVANELPLASCGTFTYEL